MLVGLKILVIIAIMGGLIAYMGDKLGTKVGKRRMSLFGLRPKHTSIIVTFVTGLLVAAATVGVLTITSQSVRTALFGMDQLRADMNQLTAEVAAKNAELEQGQALLEANKKELADRMAEIETIRKEVEQSRQELADAEAAKVATEAELSALQASYDEASKKLAALEATRASMEKHIADLQKTQEELKTGTILFQVDQLLAQAVVRNGLSPNEARDAVNSIVEDTNKLVLRRLGVEDHGESVVYVDRQNIEVAISKIEESKTPMVIQVVAAGNIIAGEPAVATIHVYPQQFIYKSGDVIATSVIDGGSNAQVNMLRFLKQVNEEAKSKGVIPDSLSGDIGTIPGDELFSAIRRISMLHGKVYVEAYADGDTYSSGPVHIKLRITQMTDTGKLIKSN